MTETMMTAGFRLSPQQRLAWSLWEQGGGPYSAVCVVRIDGPLDPARLEEALGRVAARHEILRTTFRRLAGVEDPLQLVEEPGMYPRSPLAVLEEPAIEPGEMLARLVARFSQEPPDLERGPCLRAFLASRSATVHLLGLSLPVLCCDEAGMTGLVRDLGLCYAAAPGTGSPGDEAPQYIDLAEVFNQIAESEDTRAGRRYWSGLQAASEERSSSPFSPRAVAIRLGEAEAPALEDLAREQESTVEAVLLTCWQAVLGRLSGGAPPVLGVRYDGRTFEGLEHGIGLFARYLPLRAEIAGEQRFDQALRRTGSALAEAGKWQDYFVRAGLAEAPPAWSYAFEMAAPVTAMPAGGLEWRIAARHTCIDRCILRLAASAGDGTIDLTLHFDESRLTAADAERTASALRAVIAAAVAAPESSLDSLAPLDEEALRRDKPAETEAFLLRHPQVREALVVTREGEDGYERLVALFVPERQPAPSAEELRLYLEAGLPKQMVPDVFVPLAALPRDADGKLDRTALAAVSDTGLLRPRQPFVEPRTPTEKALAAIWSEILRIEKIGIDDNFFDLGGDSILSLQIVSRANQAGIPLAPRHVFRHQTIAALAAAAGGTKAAAEQGELTGALPLTPAQHRFFAAEPAAPHHFNQAVLLGLRRPLARATLDGAMRRLADHHDALRLRFARTDQGWSQLCAPAGEILPGIWIDLSALPQARRREAVETVSAAVQEGLCLGGPLGRWACFDGGGQDLPRLLLVFHHLVVDGVSWRILLEDLETLCGPGGPVAQLPPKTTSYKSWAEGLVERARSASLQDELGFWLAAEGSEAVPLPVDSADGPNSVASAGLVQMTLGEEETRLLLQTVPRIYQTRIDEVLLTALVQAWASWTGDPTLWVDLEGHGREALPDADVSRTVGWFTAFHPVRLALADGMEPAAALLSIQEQLRAVPARGTGHGLLLSLHNDEDTRRRLAALPRPQVVFNYLGQFDQVLGEGSLFAPVSESAGPTRAPQQDRWHLLEVTGIVVEECLQVSWTYSRNRHSRAAIEGLGHAYMAALRTLLDRWRQGDAAPLDLLPGIDGEDLDRALENVEFEV